MKILVEWMRVALAKGASLRHRFDSKYVASESGCWEWIAGKDTDGYGRFGVSSRLNKKANRVAFLLAHGPYDDQLSVLHRCDNPACVRPSHLFLGTQAENVRDMLLKGRRRSGPPETNPFRVSPPVGELNARAKLTAGDVAKIRIAYADGETQVSLAARFDVSQTTISRIVLRKRWSKSTEAA